MIYVSIIEHSDDIIFFYCVISQDSKPCLDNPIIATPKDDSSEHPCIIPCIATPPIGAPITLYIPALNDCHYRIVRSCKQSNNANKARYEQDISQHETPIVRKNVF